MNAYINAKFGRRVACASRLKNGLHRNSLISRAEGDQLDTLWSSRACQPHGEPLGEPRVTLVGNVHPVLNTELAEVRKLYLERHANSKYWVDFKDFSFYRMDVIDVYSAIPGVGEVFAAHSLVFLTQGHEATGDAI